jgi:hypothetical protein
LIALANSVRASGAVAGNTDIYSVAGTAPKLDSGSFFDIAVGNNGGEIDDLAGKGYDLVTGLGSPVASSLVPALVNLVVVTPDFSLAAGNLAVKRGSSAEGTVTVAFLNGFSGTVALSVSGLPKGATATFNPASISASGSSTMTVGTTSSGRNSTPSGSYTLTITGQCTNPALKHTTTVALTVN